MEPKNNSKTVGIIVGIVIIIAVILATVLLGRKSPSAEVPSQAAPATTDTTTTQIPPVDTTHASTSVYKDGTYSATGSYMSPGGPDKIAITLTLKNDVIADISATPMPGDSTSARYQNKFISGCKQYVIGQNIDSIHLTKVSGSSLTSAGFNDALAQIKVQAKA